MQTTSDSPAVSAASSTLSSALPSRTNSWEKDLAGAGMPTFCPDALSDRLQSVPRRAAEVVLDNPLAQLLMLRSDLASMPPSPLTLGKPALQPALSTMMQQFSRSGSPRFGA